MAFFIIALSSGPLVQASEETPKLRATQPQAEPRRKLDAEYKKCAKFGANFPYPSDESGCLAAGCLFFKAYYGDVCEPQSWHRPQQFDKWSEVESPCLGLFNDRLDGSAIVEYNLRSSPEGWISQRECERICRAQPGATACQWDDSQWAREYSDFTGEPLGFCKYFTDSDATKIYDCQSVWYDDDLYDFDPCLDNYEGNTYWCKVFGAKVVQTKSATTCTGKDFKDSFKTVGWKFQGTRVFNCGNKKTKTKCTLGCKRGYTLENDPAGKSVKGGTKSKYFATCLNGEVYHGMLPQCKKKSKR